MDTASFTSLLRTLLWILLIYYGFKIFFRLFGPAIFQSAVKRAEQNIYQQYQQQQNQESQQQEYSAPKQDKPREKKKIGEYIDYEELE